MAYLGEYKTQMER